MSASEENTSPVPQEVPKDRIEQESESPPSKEKKSAEGVGGTILFFFVLGFVASLIVGWVIFPKLLYSRKKQPFDFNHALHVEEVDGGCESCHYFREDGSFSGIPKLAECIECHQEVNGTSPEEEKFVNQYVATGQEVPWLAYSRQPPCVFFSHAAHVITAKMACESCHGPHGESTESRIYEENRLTGYSRDIWGRNIAGIKKNSWDRMKMNDCANCHAKAAELSVDTTIQGSLSRQLMEMAAVVFPGATVTEKGSSVQTGRDACFVCHK